MRREERRGEKWKEEGKIKEGKENRGSEGKKGGRREKRKTRKGKEVESKI